jgi:dUTPase
MNVVGQSISELVKTNNLSETERGSNGFGSTGNN